MLFTVFTPVFNRRHLIHRVWESLQSQTCRDFEWIVVDDGSTDNVIELLREYERLADFPVLLIQQENRGKHVAMNRAVQLANGDFFIEADSDDSFVPEALERFQFHWSGLSERERAVCAGIGCLCIDTLNAQVHGENFPQSGVFETWLDLFYKHKVRGEKWWCIRTDLRRAHLLPEVSGSSYFPERVYYSRISRGHQFYIVNEALRNFHQDSSVSLTRPKRDAIRRNAEAFYLARLIEINEEIDYIVRYSDCLSIVRLWGRLWYYAFFARKRPVSVISDLNWCLPKLCGIFFFPVGLFFYCLKCGSLRKG